MIWFDVTTLLQWQGRPVGIVRVLAECARRFAEHDDISFCRYDNQHLNYVPVSAEEVLARIEHISSNQHTTYVQKKKVSVKKNIRNIFYSILMLAPGNTTVLLFDLYIKFRKKIILAYWHTRNIIIAAIRTGRKIAHSIRSMKNQKKSPGDPVSFSSDDIYISCGLDWDCNNFEILYNLKKTYGFRCVLFCYDVIPLRLPHLTVSSTAENMPLYFANLSWCADIVLCISKNSQKDFEIEMEKLGAPVPDTKVFYLGSSVYTGSASQETVATMRCILDEHYILYVSTIEPRKNHSLLHQAYRRIIEQGATDLPLLVFVGAKGWNIDDFMLMLGLDPLIRPYIRILSNVTDEELALLYSHAYMTVYPSWYEGWGLPLVESLAHGKFCLAADSSSLPEAGGDCAEYIDPYDIPAWSERLLYYFQHPEEVAKRERYIQENFIPLQWDDTASAVLEAAYSL